LTLACSWQGEDNSPASFEKTLSTLSTKITQTTNRLDGQQAADDSAQQKTQGHSRRSDDRSFVPLREFAQRRLRLAAPAFVCLAVATCATAAWVQPGIRTAWAAHTIALTVISVLFAATTAALLRAIGGRVDGRPFFLALALFVLGVAGLGFGIFPDIVPFRLTLWAAASSTLSHVFLLVGALIVTPVVLAYSAFAYRTFRGKTPEAGWEA